MKLLGPTQYPRLNEGIGLVLLALGIALTCALVSYHPLDPSWNTATSLVRPVNLIGRVGATASDALLQLSGLGSFTVPLLLVALAWKWFRSDRIEAQFIKVTGAITLVLGVCTALALGPPWRPFGGAIVAGGLAGRVCADFLVSELNPFGAMLLTGFVVILSLYLVSRFSLNIVWNWLKPVRGLFLRAFNRYGSWADKRRHERAERAQQQAERVQQKALRREIPKPPQQPLPPGKPAPAVATPVADTRPPWETTIDKSADSADAHEIPIHALEDYQPATAGSLAPPPPPQPFEAEPVRRQIAPPAKKAKSQYLIPPTELLQEPQARPPYDSQELKDIAIRIKSRFEEFNVTGSVTQINPGPVVTTFEYKPDAGVKYSRITNLSEDLCLGLQAESILIERIPGKQTVGIEVPNTRREVISLR
ncbi:MAG: DNA translocase FtsK 4TM domain-containing protein, partial [Bryobacteraceae bacterium]|nr:DNA translocase FtsK 4TM domain-containing protein [Bryobacteraceae bacterium]